MFPNRTNPWAAILTLLKLLLVVLVFGVRVLVWVVLALLTVANVIFSAASGHSRSVSREALRRTLWGDPF